MSASNVFGISELQKNGSTRKSGDTYLISNCNRLIKQGNEVCVSLKEETTKTFLIHFSHLIIVSHLQEVGCVAECPHHHHLVRRCVRHITVLLGSS